MEAATKMIYELSKELNSYEICENFNVPLNECQSYSYMIMADGKFRNFHVQVIDSVKDYVEFMKQIFDFEEMRAFIKSGFVIKLDCLSGGMLFFTVFTFLLYYILFNCSLLLDLIILFHFI